MEELYTSQKYFEETDAVLKQVPCIYYERSMGDYAIFYKFKRVGGIYRDRLLVRITPGSRKLLGPVAQCLPYPNSREHFLVEERDPEFLHLLFQTIWDESPYDPCMQLE